LPRLELGIVQGSNSLRGNATLSPQTLQGYINRTELAL
jgi:hypothetical protein